MEHVQETKCAVQDQRTRAVKSTEQTFEEFNGILLQWKRTLLEKVENVSANKIKALEMQEADFSIAVAKIQQLMDIVQQCGAVDGSGGSQLCAGIMSRIETELEDHSRSGKSMEPVEEADMEVRCAEALQQLCQNIVEITHSPVDLDQCTVEFEPCAEPVIGQISTVLSSVTLRLANGHLAWRRPGVEAKLKSLYDNHLVKCTVHGHSINCYVITFEPDIRGRHELTMVMDGCELGQPLALFVAIPPSQLGVPVAVWDHTDMRDPSGIAINSAGHVIVAEWKNGSIFIFDRNGDVINRVPVAKYITNKIYGVAVDDDDNIYCTERYGNNDKILKCDKDGNNITVEVVSPMKNQRGLMISGEELLVCDDDQPGSVAVYNRERKGVGRIQVHLHKDQTFHDLASDHHGNIYASAMDRGAFMETDEEGGKETDEAVEEETARHRDGGMNKETGRAVHESTPCVHVFERTGGLLRSFSCDSDGVQKLDLPRYICVANGLVYVSDWQLNEVVVFTTDGDYITSFGEEGKDVGQFKNPWGVCVDVDGFVYVCDSNNHRVQVF